MDSSHAQTELPRFKPHRALGWFTVLLVVLCTWIARDFMGTLLLASWLVTTFYALFARLARVTKVWVSALLLTSGILLIIVVPVLLALILLGSRVAEFVRQGIDLWNRGDILSSASAWLGQPEASLPNSISKMCPVTSPQPRRACWLG